jgi:ParB family transcriptional regulator, chromosome partitioning protein
MSKRTQSIRSLFAGGNEKSPTEDVRQPVQRVASGAVRSLKDTFSEVERDYEELKKQVSSGALAIELDPASLDPSPFADRFVDQDLAAVEALKTSFKEHGQEIPILVRVNPTASGRYQIAYGHRRVRAASELGMTVRAYVRELDDNQLVVAQGVENSAREDLTFIERAMFALKLAEGGIQRSMIQTALSIDRQEAQKLLSVAHAVPRWLIDAIGRAPKVGRPRWLDLSESLKAAGAEKAARKATEDRSFAHKETDDRFAVVLRATRSGDAKDSARPQASAVAISLDGKEIASLALSSKHCKIQINRERDEAFASYLMERLPELYADFRGDAPSTEDKA